MLATTSCAKTVERMLYKKSSFESQATIYGCCNERVALKEAEEKVRIKIQPCGFFVDAEMCGIGATPDGLIGEDGIVEVKCPHTARQYSPEKAYKHKILSVHQLYTDDTLKHLNKKHKYYY